MPIKIFFENGDIINLAGLFEARAWLEGYYYCDDAGDYLEVVQKIMSDLEDYGVSKKINMEIKRG